MGRSEPSLAQELCAVGVLVPRKLLVAAGSGEATGESRGVASLGVRCPDAVLFRTGFCWVAPWIYRWLDTCPSSVPSSSHHPHSRLEAPSNRAVVIYSLAIEGLQCVSLCLGRILLSLTGLLPWNPSSLSPLPALGVLLHSSSWVPKANSLLLEAYCGQTSINHSSDLSGTRLCLLTPHVYARAMLFPPLGKSPCSALHLDLLIPCPSLKTHSKCLLFQEDCPTAFLHRRF